MFICTYVAALLAIVFATFAATFLYKHKNEPVRLALAAYLISCAAWIGGNAAADVSYTLRALILTSEIALVGGIISLLCVLVLVDLLVDRKPPSGWRLMLYAAPTVALCALGFSPLGIVRVSFPANQPAEIIPGIAYSFTLIAVLVVFAYGLFRLFHAVRSRRPYVERIQLLYVLTGLLVTVSGQLIFDILLPLFGNYSLYSVGPITSLFFAVFTGYAITRHNLFDIRIVIQRGAIFSVLLLALLVTYAVVINTLGMIAFINEDTSEVIGGAVATVLGVFCAPIIERSFRKATDRLFFTDHYDYAEAIHTLSEILYTHLELSDIVRHAEEGLTRILRASFVRIDSTDEIGTGATPAATLSLPVILEGASVATIVVGEKRSGDPYTKQDIQLLSTFACHAATSIGRARLYLEVSQHASELAVKVEERTEELRKAHESQRRMFIDISHNLQTPLTIFQGKIEGLKQLLPNDHEVTQFERSITSLSRFVYDLLSLTALEHTTHEDHAALSLSALLNDVTDEIEIIASMQHIIMQKRIALDCWILGNEKQVREAIMNLASNAVKYIGTRSERLMTLTLEVRSGVAVLRLSDTGIGIPPDEVPHIFERFYRSTNTPHAVRGTGLGLAITKQIIELHGGSISVESELGVGTTFEIIFPTHIIAGAD